MSGVDVIIICSRVQRTYPWFRQACSGKASAPLPPKRSSPTSDPVSWSCLVVGWLSKSQFESTGLLNNSIKVWQQLSGLESIWLYWQLTLVTLDEWSRPVKCNYLISCLSGTTWMVVIRLKYCADYYDLLSCLSPYCLANRTDALTLVQISGWWFLFGSGPVSVKPKGGKRRVELLLV